MMRGTSLRQRAPEIRRHGLDVGISCPEGIGRLHERRPQPAAEHRLDLLGRGGDDRLFGLRAMLVHHGLPHDADAHALERARVPRIVAWLAYGVLNTDERGTVV